MLCYMLRIVCLCSWFTVALVVATEVSKAVVLGGKMIAYALAPYELSALRHPGIIDGYPNLFA